MNKVNLKAALQVADIVKTEQSFRGYRKGLRLLIFAAVLFLFRTLFEKVLQLNITGKMPFLRSSVKHRCSTPPSLTA